MNFQDLYNLFMDHDFGLSENSGELYLHVWSIPVKFMESF